MSSSALSKLVNTIQRPSHDLRPSVQIFPDLDVNRVADDLRLEALGTERGSQDEPRTASVAADEIEARITERVEAEKKAAHGLAEDELRTHAERLSSLDFDGRFSALSQAVPACVGEFKAEIVKGLNLLHALRRDFHESEAALMAFRESHGLKRPAHIHSASAKFLKWSLILFVFLLEAFLNGSFLAKGSEQGLLGGITEAFGFAFLNIGAALLLSIFGVVQLNHRGLFRKLIGLIALCAYIAITLVLNLALAHYREVSAGLVEGGGALVIQRLTEAPLLLSDLNSWIFFGIGIVFSLIAFIDGLFLSDGYPGYASIQKRRDVARTAYSDGVSDLIDDLRGIRDEYCDEMDELTRDIGVRRSQYDAILSSRSRLIHLFEQHQAHLERSGGVLMNTYREANSRARSSKPPSRFSQPFKLDRVALQAHSTGEWNPEELRSRILATQALLTEKVQSIHSEFEAAVEKYRRLDDLIPDEVATDGAR